MTRGSSTGAWVGQCSDVPLVRPLRAVSVPAAPAPADPDGRRARPSREGLPPPALQGQRTARLEDGSATPDLAASRTIADADPGTRRVGARRLTKDSSFALKIRVGGDVSVGAYGSVGLASRHARVGR